MVAIILLVVTYGVYQVVTRPAPGLPPAAQTETAVESSMSADLETIPKKVLDGDLLADDTHDSPKRHLQDDRSSMTCRK